MAVLTASRFFEITPYGERVFANSQRKRGLLSMTGSRTHMIRLVTQLGGLRRTPPLYMRPPAAHVSAIFVIIRSELLAQRRLFIEDDEEVHAQYGNHSHNGSGQIEVAENNPKPDPPGGGADVNRVSHMAVVADNNQSLRWSKWGRSASSCLGKIPDAAKRNRESQNGGDCRQPAPTGSTNRFHAEAQPPGK